MGKSTIVERGEYPTCSTSRPAKSDDTQVLDNVEGYVSQHTVSNLCNHMVPFLECTDLTNVV